MYYGLSEIPLIAILEMCVGKTQKLEGLLPLLMTAVDSESKVKGPLYLLQAYLQFAKGMSDQKHLKLASHCLKRPSK